MPLTYRIDTERRLVTITGDYADAAEWRRLLGTVREDAAFGGGFSFIRDLRGSAHPVDAETVIGIIAVVREFWIPLAVRRAAIVTRQAINNPALVAHALAEHEQIPLRAFTSYDDALAWLSEPS